MGMNIFFRVFFSLIFFFAFDTVYAAGPFLGCADFCRSRFQVGTKSYDNCLVQTQMEGQCGGTSKSSSGSKRGAGGQTPTAQASCERTRQECDRSGGTFSDKGGVCSCVANGENSNEDSQIHPSCQPGAITCGGDQDLVKNSDGTCSCSNSSNEEAGSGSGEEAGELVGPPASVAACVQEYAQLQQACVAELQQASYTCDEKNDSGMNSAADTASQLALALGQQTSASIMAACSKMAGVAQAANAALAAYRLNCNSAINSCRSACSQVKQYIQNNSYCLVSTMTSSTYDSLMANADGEAQKCTAFENKTNQAQQAIQNYGATSANAAQCAALTSGDPASLAAYCAKNPTQLVCQTAQAADCSNPQVAATNKICICAKTPNDPRCLKTQKPTDPNAIGGNIDSSSRLANKASADYSGDIPNLPSIAHGQRGSGGGESIDGSQGGAGVGGGGGGSGAGGGGGASAAERTANINGGFYGGGGNRFGSGGGGAGGGPGGRGYAASPGRNTASGPDLRKFLPGGQYDPRRAAGVSGPDGITGPHSNIWQKVQNRYRVMSPSLLP